MGVPDTKPPLQAWGSGSKPEQLGKFFNPQVKLCQGPLVVKAGPYVYHWKKIRARITMNLDASGEGLLKSVLKLSKNRIGFRV